MSIESSSRFSRINRGGAWGRVPRWAQADNHDSCPPGVSGPIAGVRFVRRVV